MQTVEILFNIKVVGQRRRHFVLANVEVPDNWNEMDEHEQHHYMTLSNEKYGYSHPFHGGVDWAPSPMSHFVITPLARLGHIIEEFDFSMVTHPTKRAADKSQRRLFTNLVACGSCR